MNKVKIALLALIAVLLVVQIVDRSREPAQLRAVQESLDRLNATLQRGMASAPMRAGGGAAVAQPAAVDPRLDGVPRLGENFLKPYDASHFDPDKLRGTLREFSASPKGLNPIIENSADQSEVEGLVNDSLCSQHPASPQQWSQNLATACVISDDFRTYTFTLRPGVMWQRPQIAKQERYRWLDRDVELTAEDFAFGIRLIMDPTVECPQLKAYYEEDLESVKALDSHTLEVRWKRKVYTSLAASMSLTPVPKHVYSRNADGSEIPAERLGSVFNNHWFDQERQFIGVGGYILERFEPDKAIAFRRNPDYWGASLHFEELVWDGEVKQPDPQLVAFKNGQVHYHGLNPNQFKSEILDGREPRFAKPDPSDPKAGRAGVFGWERVRSSSYSYIGWNLRLDLFRDKKVRQALTHAFPKERIIDEVYFGLGRPQITNVHPDSIYFNAALPDYAFDLARAKQLLSEAGWTDSNGDGWIDRDFAGVRKPFRFQLKYIANRPEWDSTLLIYRNELRKIGIDMEPRPYEWKELLRVYEDKDFDAIAGGWQFGLEVDFYQLWHSRYASEPRSSNHIGFVNKRADEIAEELRSTFDQQERIRIAKEFQAIIHDEQPYTFFRSSEGIFVWQNRGPNDAGQRWLDGVTAGLDTYHPLFSRSKLLWHFRRD